MPEKGLWTRTYSTGDQVPDRPVFTRAKNKFPSWDFYKFAMTNTMKITRKQKSEGKLLHGRFERLIYNIPLGKTWTGLRKGNFKRETEYHLIAAQDSAIRTNHIKARIDKTQRNSKCRLYVHRDETINQIISECSKLAQKESKTKHDWVGKVIHWEMGKKIKFDNTNKCYMLNQAPVQENDARNLLWDFDIQTDHLISAKRPDHIIINKKENLQNCRHCYPSWPQNKSGRKLKEG